MLLGTGKTELLNRAYIIRAFFSFDRGHGNRINRARALRVPFVFDSHLHSDRAAPRKYIALNRISLSTIPNGIYFIC